MYSLDDLRISISLFCHVLRETELQCLISPRSLLRPARKKKGGVPKDVAGVLRTWDLE